MLRIGHNLSLICQLTSEDIKHQLNNNNQCWSIVQCCLTSTETVRLIGTESPGRPPRLSHSSWILTEQGGGPEFLFPIPLFPRPSVPIKACGFCGRKAPWKKETLKERKTQSCVRTQSMRTQRERLTALGISAGGGSLILGHPVRQYPHWHERERQNSNSKTLFDKFRFSQKPV